MERRRQENERWMQALLHQMKRLRKENEELQAQMSTVGPSQSWHTQSRQTASRQTIEASFPEGIEFSFGSYSR